MIEEEGMIREDGKLTIRKIDFKVVTIKGELLLDKILAKKICSRQ